MIVIFSYLNYLHSFRAENKLKCHEKLCKDENFMEWQCHQERVIYHNLKLDVICIKMNL